MKSAGDVRINSLRHAQRNGHDTGLGGDDKSLLFVQRAIAKMQDELEHGLNAKAFAREMKVSYSTFRHTFKQRTGFSPLQYQMELRLMRACNLLVKTTQRVKEIAKRVGFEDEHCFFRIFKKKIGFTPNQWRRSQRKQRRLAGELCGMKLHHPLLGHLYKINLSTGGCVKTASGCTLHDSHPFGVNATATGLEYFSGTSTDWAMSISRQTTQPLTVQIESWPDDPDVPRQWLETSLEVEEAAQHIVTHLRPNAIYELKTNGKVTASMRANKTGCIKFTHERGYTEPQRFELSLATR